MANFEALGKARGLLAATWRELPLACWYARVDFGLGMAHKDKLTCISFHFYY